MPRIERHSVAVMDRGPNVEEQVDHILTSWRQNGIRSIERSFGGFRELVALARRCHEAGRPAAAAAYVEMAALFAVSNHCGLFASSELERLVVRIGEEAIPGGPPTPAHAGETEPLRVLHVATLVKPIGGLSRMIWRWIRQDSGRIHSVALTRQRHAVPRELVEAVHASGGRIHRVNEAVGGVLTWARRLRSLAAAADVVVLHIGNRDVVPLLALADPGRRPKVIYLNHSDHLFWLGVGISDVVASLRESGLHLARTRRGIEPGRNAVLPIILDPPERTLSRADAKNRLRLPENATVLLSVARGVKYRTVGGVSYAEAHLPFLRQNPEAILVVVGAGDRPDWSDAVQAAHGRIIVHQERADTDLFYQAADIYVDSFPFVSTTSLLEAGCYETPLVTRFPYSEASAILGADMPGLAGTMIWTRGLDDYTSTLSRLASDPALRTGLGAATRAGILKAHTGSGWQAALEEVYRHALSGDGFPRCIAPPDRPSYLEPDILLPSVHDHPIDVSGLMRSQLGILPLDLRFRRWINLVLSGRPRDRVVRDLVRCWLPDWVLVRLRRRILEV